MKFPVLYSACLHKNDLPSAFAVVRHKANNARHQNLISFIALIEG